MTKTRKLKCIIQWSLVWAIFIYVHIKILTVIDNNDPVVIEEIESISQRLNENTGANVVKYKKNNISNTNMLVSIIPQDTLELLIITYGVEYCDHLSIILISTVEELDWIRMLFKYLSEYDMMRLIAIIHTMTDRQVRELVNLLIQYNPREVSDIINIFSKLDNNNLVFLLRDLDKQLLRQLLKMLLSNKSYKILLIYNEHELNRLMNRVKHEYWILPLMFEMNTDLHKLLPIIEKIPNDSLKELSWFFQQLTQSEKLEFITLMNTMNPAHIINALTIVYNNRNMVDSSKKYFLTLKQRLGLSDTTLVIEKSINLASKVDDNTRMVALTKLQELRAVKIRRIIKQVDGYNFSGGTITGMTYDSNVLDANDFDNYSNILSGSQGFIHGSYRSSDKEVSQERKIHVITELYSGNVEKRQQHFDFMNKKQPVLVPHRFELETVTKDPDKIILQNN